MDGSKAIRGGIPVVFPNFGPWKLGPQHGFARISQWTVELKGDDYVILTLKVGDLEIHGKKIFNSVLLFRTMMRHVKCGIFHLNYATPFESKVKSYVSTKGITI